MTAARLRHLFAELKAGLLPLLAHCAGAEKPLEQNLWRHDYPVADQRALSLRLAQGIGYDLERGRLDTAPHPFEISFTREDVRITTRYDRHYLPMALFGTLHEAGHGLYEQNIEPQLTRGPLTTDFPGMYAVGGASYGAHECSSRLWENIVGRSHAYWEANIDAARAAFPQQLGGVDATLFWRAVNRVRPGFIRVEADEVSYNLHIMLRVELELGLMEGSLAVAELPEAWNAGMQELLGIVPPNDRLGVLQDVHWSGGGFGSFPAYTIGNVMSAQFMEAAGTQLPPAAELARDAYAPLLAWLGEHLYRHGRAFSGEELLQRATGRGLEAAPYLRYLRDKFGPGSGWS